MCVREEAWTGAVQHSEAFEKDYWSADNIHDSVGPIINIIANDEEEENFVLNSIEV